MHFHRSGNQRIFEDKDSVSKHGEQVSETLNGQVPGFPCRPAWRGHQQVALQAVTMRDHTMPLCRRFGPHLQRFDSAMPADAGRWCYGRLTANGWVLVVPEKAGPLRKRLVALGEHCVAHCSRAALLRSR